MSGEGHDVRRIRFEGVEWEAILMAAIFLAVLFFKK